ncbi:MAG TPA: MFS transporter [Telmatospirillum sp.]|nr:MFS transporter [Telmatospirillum sp.]
MSIARKNTIIVCEVAGNTAAPLPRYRWVILLVAFLVLVTSFIVRLAWGNAAIGVRDSLSLGATTLGSFVTAFYIGYVIANTFGGFAADRFGPSRALFCALLPLGVFTFCFGFVGNLYQGLAIQALMGLSAGINFSATTKIVSAWFPPAHRGGAFGLLATASSIPIIIANATFPYIIQTFSWGALYRGLGGFTILIATICFFTLRDTPLEQATQDRGPVSKPGMITAIRQILGNRDLVIFALAGFGGMWGTWGFAFWSNALMVKGHGFSPVTAGAIMALFGLGAVVAKPLYGFLSDALGGQRKNLMMLCFVGFAVMLMLFGSRDGELAFKCLAPILGVTAFAYNPLQTALLSELIGKNTVGTAAGLNNAFWQLGSMIVPVVVGFVFEQTSSFYAAFAVLACGPLLGAICMAFVHEPDMKSKD